MSEHRTFTLDEIEQQTGFDKRTIAYYVQQGLLPKVGRRGPKTRYPQNFLDRLQFVNLIREKQDLGEVGSLTLAEIRDILDRVPSDTIADVVAGQEPLHAVDFHHPQDAIPTIIAPSPKATGSAFQSSAMAEEVAEISESLLDEVEISTAAFADANRRVRLGMLDPSSDSPDITDGDAKAALEAVVASPSRLKAALAMEGENIRPPRRYEDEIKAKAKELEQTSADSDTETDADTDADESSPPSIEVERLGWFLARLQRAMTGDRRRRTGTTESWHRALITPELTISARNLKDTDAYLLDAVARILKKLLWEAWEE